MMMFYLSVLLVRIAAFFLLIVTHLTYEPVKLRRQQHRPLQITVNSLTVFKSNRAAIATREISMTD